VPGSRQPKRDREDSLFAEVLKTPRTIRSCLSFYQKPDEHDGQIDEVSTLMTLGDGMNGHPSILHGGIVASILDEAMGILQTVNHERDHLLRVGKGLAEGELPPHGIGAFTVELKVRFRAPVRTPGSLVVTARYVRREGRKEWIYAEVTQHLGPGGDDDGEEVVCATGEALFVQPKSSKL